MTYQKSLADHEAEGNVEWEYCYVCGGSTFHALADLGGPTHHYDIACKECQKHGAPHYKPEDWTSKKSATVLSKRKAAEPPPAKPRPLTKDEKEREKRLSDILSHMW